MTIKQLRRKHNIFRKRYKKDDMQRNNDILMTEKLFYRWLEENMGAFPYKPVFLKKEGAQLIYTFEKICKKITLQIALYLPEAMICYRESDAPDELWSIHKVLEYIGEEAYDQHKGYYDADRTDGIYTYFPTKEELYIKEVFETIPKFCQENLKADMCIYTSKGLSSFSATIAPCGNDQENIKGWWGNNLFYGEIQGDDEAVNYLKDHKRYMQSFDLFSCEESQNIHMKIQ